MKTRLFAVLLVLFALLMVGCSSTQKNGEETVHAVAEGEFAARVTACFADIPAYEESDMTGFVLVNEFQGWPFLINPGDREIASKLETGQAYVFTIKPYDMGEIPVSRIGEKVPRIEEWAMKATITGWRPAEEGEFGVVSLMPVYAPYPEN